MQSGARFCGVLQAQVSTLDFSLSSQNESQWRVLSRGVKYSDLHLKRFALAAGWLKG